MNMFIVYSVKRHVHSSLSVYFTLAEAIKACKSYARSYPDLSFHIEPNV